MSRLGLPKLPLHAEAVKLLIRRLRPCPFRFDGMVESNPGSVDADIGLARR